MWSLTSTAERPKAQDFEGRVARLDKPARADVENERQRWSPAINRHEIMRLPWADCRCAPGRERQGLAIDNHAGDRSPDVKDQMPLAMGMRHHRPIQLIEASAPERTMCDRVSNTHRFPPRPSLCAVMEECIRRSRCDNRQIAPAATGPGRLPRTGCSVLTRRPRECGGSRLGSAVGDWQGLRGRSPPFPQNGRTGPD